MAKEKFYIKTLGCKVNQYESQQIREGFLRAGYSEAASADEAGIYVVNTCTVTSTSDSKSLRMIRRGLRHRDKCVIATGCMVEDDNLDLSGFKGSSFIIKNKDKHRIAEIVSHSAESGAHSENITGFKNRARVFVKVQDGCDNFCSYCKVRLVRGKSKSRPLRDIINECSALIKNGTKEIVLTGICLGAYGKDIGKGLDISRLVNELCAIEGDWRLRLSSIEPKDVNDELISQLRLRDRLCRHLHIPFQSGDDYILKMMNRPYKNKDYIDIVRRLRDAVPDIAVSTDIMVGFPGETERMFANTIDFLNIVRPMRTHIFPFSKRKGTAACNYKDNIVLSVKKERENRLSLLTTALSREFIDSFVDKEVEVLVEEKRTGKGDLQGYAGGYIKVYIKGPDKLKGTLVNSRPRPALTNLKAYGILPSYLI